MYFRILASVENMIDGLLEQQTLTNITVSSDSVTIVVERVCCMVEIQYIDSFTDDY